MSFGRFLLRPFSGGLLIGFVFALSLSAAAAYYFDYRHQQRTEAKYARRNRTVPENLDISVDATIRFHSLAELRSVRADLISTIWNSSSLPRGWSHLSPLGQARIFDLPPAQQLRVAMPGGVVSNVYYWPSQSSCLNIYHEGHQPVPVNQPILKDMISTGCAALYVNMIACGGNPQPAYEGAQGRLTTFPHEALMLLDLENWHPLRLFLEPVLQSINFAIADGHYDTISMVGLSGGGWTTVLYSALDTRIQNSFPVAGTTPLYIKSYTSPDTNFEDWGDYEQVHPDLISRVTYQELYVMATDNGRYQLQIQNKYDPCCNAGEANRHYASAVSGRAELLGGHWQQIIDDTHYEHAISDYARDVIIQSIRGRSR